MWPGFSFALHLLRVQGFYFALLQYSHIQAFTACFVSSMQLYRTLHKTAHGALQALFLRLHPLNRHRYQTDTSGYNTTCATLERITAPGRPAPIPQMPPPRRTLYRSAQPPIIIRYIRVQGCACYGSMPDGATHRRPCRPVGVSVSTCTGSARRLSIWHRVSLTPSTRRGSPAAKARRAARNHWRLSPYLFSGFRPIANRGQQ